MSQSSGMAVKRKLHEVPGRQEIDGLIKAISAKEPHIRFSSVKKLRILSKDAPELLYPHFDFFRGLLKGGNSIIRWNAILTIGNLAAADRDGKIDAILEDYLSPIDGRHLIDATNTIHGATAIGLVKPQLADRIASSVLGTEHGRYETAECRNVAMGHAIECLDKLFDAISDKRSVQRFVSEQIGNARSATRKKAERFFHKHPAPAQH